MTRKYEKGEFFSDELQEQIKSKFFYLDNDPRHKGRRLFFDNGGGALRLKSTVEAFKRMDSFPDCSERGDISASYLDEICRKGMEDIRIIFNAKSGSILTEISASQVIFKMTGAVIENVPGTNVVVTAGDHPSAYDAAVYYAKKTGKELRVAKTNPATGGSDVEDIVKLIDKDTCLLSFIYASNTSGAILDAKAIVEAARKVKPDLYVLLDAVQFAPHGVMDVEDLQVDGINFAPYKFFSNRGLGIGCVSDRLSTLPHHRLEAVSEDCWAVGSPAPGQFAAVTEIVNYVTWIGSQYIDSDDRRELFVEGMSRIKLQERALMNRMLNGTSEIAGLRGIPGVTVYLDVEDLTTKEFLVGMGFDNMTIEESARELEKVGIVTYPRTDDSRFSKRMLESFGITGLVRVTPLHCHTREDMDDFLTEVAKIANR
ncbi:aminotransferase class V-fold PLP-dependent enzyme [Wukongibacter baidiensis]|uniref:aminotransferase class V-fold PLP-dependent enzyme n=1 Tax=Wukongibacter baidiensis TaxID=1723361 RepID=UPI003D7F43B1